MGLENEQEIRAEMIREGYKAKQIDDIHKHIGVSYGQLKEMGETIKNFYLGSGAKNNCLSN